MATKRAAKQVDKHPVPKVRVRVKRGRTEKVRITVKILVEWDAHDDSARETAIAALAKILRGGLPPETVAGIVEELNAAAIIESAAV